MKRLAVLLCLLGAGLGCEFLDYLHLPVNVGEGDGVLKCPDALLLPGDPVTFVARFKSVTGFTKYKGQRLQMLLDGTVVDEAATDSNGEARLRFVPPGTGDYRLTLRVAEGEEKTASPIAVCVCVRPADARIIVTDIDHTISDASGMEVVRGEHGEITPIDGAARCLGALAREHTIVYVTAREDYLDYKTRNWLDAKGFPTGPLYSWNVFSDKFSRRSYKSSTIKHIMSVWPNVVAGIGDIKRDAWAYRDARIPNIFIIGMDDPDERDECPDGTMFVATWDEVLAALGKR